MCVVLFLHRRLPNGDYVKRYGELIEYLLNKSPDIHPVQMDFEGKNIMLYYLGRYHHYHYFLIARPVKLLHTLTCPLRCLPFS
jgi:hypothetical protein